MRACTMASSQQCYGHNRATAGVLWVKDSVTGTRRVCRRHAYGAMLPVCCILIPNPYLLR